jgi:Zn-dependent protease with chaperone function
MEQGTKVRTRKILRDIDPSAWEHPADKAALQALRRIPMFDEVLKKLFAIFGERPIRLTFQANAVKVSRRQFPDVYDCYLEVCETLDVEKPYPLFVSQTPIVNAGAYGLGEPFIVLNSGSIRLLDRDELTYLLGHEVGHILSGHVLYKTMTAIMLMLAEAGFPVIGIASRVVLMGLLEWQRKSELSADRAGLLAVQHPEATMRSFMVLAGGGRPDETDLNEFMIQADEYRLSGDVADVVFRVLNLLGTTHPFHVLRAAEIRDWIEKGEYERLLRGEYRRRGDAPDPIKEDLRSAAQAYAEDARHVTQQVSDAFKDMRDKFGAGFKR